MIVYGLIFIVLILIAVTSIAIIYSYKRTHLKFGFNFYLGEGKKK